MVEYSFVSRGEGLPEWIAEGHFEPLTFPDVLDHTAEPLLEPAAYERLRAFLNDPSPPDRWNKARKKEGTDLALLVRTSGRDVLIDDVKELLCRYLCGENLRPRKRPNRIGLVNWRDLGPAAKFIKQHVEICLREGRPLEVPRFGLVRDPPEWQNLPISERAMRIAHQALMDRGHKPPSVRSLRNSLPKKSMLGIYS